MLCSERFCFLLFSAIWPQNLPVHFFLQMPAQVVLPKSALCSVIAECDTIVAQLVQLQIPGKALLSNKSLFKGEQFTVCALKGSCLNSIKVATRSDISWEFKEELWPSVWNSDCSAQGGEAFLWTQANMKPLNYCCVSFDFTHHSLAV